MPIVQRHNVAIAALGLLGPVQFLLVEDGQRVLGRGASEGSQRSSQGSRAETRVGHANRHRGRSVRPRDLLGVHLLEKPGQIRSLLLRKKEKNPFESE